MALSSSNEAPAQNGPVPWLALAFEDDDVDVRTGSGGLDDLSELTEECAWQGVALGTTECHGGDRLGNSGLDWHA